MLGITQVLIASRSPASANALMQHARALGLKAQVVQDADAALADCPLTVTCTPAHGMVLSARPRADGFISAVGAFTPQMVELSPELCRYVAASGAVFTDSAEAQHEAGDLLQAGLNPAEFATLGEVVRKNIKPPVGPVLFKSCGWAGWDLAAARVALRQR